MGAAVERLTDYVTRPGGYNIPHADLRQAQLDAIGERFDERKDRIKLLGHRAADAGVTSIGSLADVVPLLFPHTAYKSYPESFLIEQRWDRLARWLGTISPYQIAPIENGDITDIDEWIARLEAAGHFVSCSSGTTGKAAMLIASAKDMEWVALESVHAFSWGSGVAPARDRLIFSISPTAAVPRNLIIRHALHEAFGKPGKEPFRYPVPPITVGSITKMITLRKKIADGTALPQELAAFEMTSAERQEAVDRAVPTSAQALVAARKEKLYILGMWASIYKIAETVRAMGYSGDDFHADNTCFIGGGLKGAQLPPNYREFVFDTFNIRPERVYQMYGMQEINTSMPRCQVGGRYHVPPWLVPLVLDRDGEALVERSGDEVEGRAAFFDLALDGRWGGVISGDRISLSFAPCACGYNGPSVRDDIARYADIQGDDKIACSGTVDAYVRGVG
ncbi:MAG: hypothetical protein JF593_10465 [Novosphingobium sp.]|nr:hypothetical protein [Novosphingobium sp.]